MTGIEIQPSAIGLASHPNKDDPTKIAKAARDFEALLLEQILKVTHSDDGEDHESTTMIELGEQQFAQALAATGGLGLAKMVIAGLTKHADR